ncbi:MAG: hypothetical protein GC171_14280 [Terrimonas sp.]|nr:hypothetical protein [Terrimonas sp.]
MFAFSGNQAALAGITDFSLGLYGEKKFLIQELSYYKIAGTIPTASGNFGIVQDYYGYAEYNETNTGIAYARKLGNKADAGLQFNYYNFRVSGYGQAGTVNVGAGVLFHLAANVHLGLQVDNPFGGRFGNSGLEKLAAVYKMGLGNEVSEKFFISAEIEKEEKKPVDFHAGLIYKIIPQCTLRLGVLTGTSSFYFGTGFQFNIFRIDFMTSYHPRLGITPGLMLIYGLKKTAP